ncbi:MAG: hypothetical protein ACRD1Z_22000 [Vicinamibacteria bacterium]
MNLAGAGGLIESRQVVTEGFEHFQICFETSVATTIRVDVAKGIYRFPRSFVSRARTPFATLAAIATTATQFHSIYFGVSTAALFGMETYRFSRVLVLQFANTGAPAASLTAWLECIG